MKKVQVQLKTIQRKAPVAPPVYRPMPVPKVLQRKTAVAGPNVNKPVPVPHVLQRKQIAPPRPGISRPAIVQTKVVQRAAAKWSMGHSEEEMSEQ